MEFFHIHFMWKIVHDSYNAIGLSWMACGQIDIIKMLSISSVENCAWLFNNAID